MNRKITVHDSATGQRKSKNLQLRDNLPLQKKEATQERRPILGGVSIKLGNHAPLKAAALPVNAAHRLPDTSDIFSPIPWAPLDRMGRKSSPLAAERLMLAVLEHATHYPTMWHDVGKDQAHRDAVAALAQEGAIDVNTVTNQFRLARKAPLKRKEP